MPIVVRIDVELAKRKMSVGEFADRVGLTPANVAVLKNGRAKAVRFSTLEAMCKVLGCQFILCVGGGGGGAGPRPPDRQASIVGSTGLRAPRLRCRRGWTGPGHW
jgi:putative transcriptional regulator